MDFLALLREHFAGLGYQIEKDPNYVGVIKNSEYCYIDATSNPHVFEVVSPLAYIGRADLRESGSIERLEEYVRQAWKQEMP